MTNIIVSTGSKFDTLLLYDHDAGQADLIAFDSPVS